MKKSKTLKHRQQWAAFLVAAGTPDRKICKKTGLEEETLQRLKRSPLFKSLVNEYAEEILDVGINQLLAQLIADAPETIQFFKDVRDGNIDDDDDRLKLRMKAGEVLLQSAIPKQSKVSGEITQRHYAVPAHRRAQIESDVKEIEVVPYAKALEERRAD